MEPSPSFKWERPVERTSLLVLVLFTVLSLASRFYRIGKGAFVMYRPLMFGSTCGLSVL